MARYAAFLRGINLGGRRVANDALRAPFEALGLADVSCFRASGNVVFEAPGRAAELAPAIEARIAADLGFEAAVFLRDASRVRAIAAAEPFTPEQIAATEGRLQVTFLPARPSPAAARRALAHADERDRLAINGAELYWLPSGRMSDSELDLRAIARELGEGTTRTIGTVRQIRAKYFTA